jgi:hypothetical protein
LKSSGIITTSYKKGRKSAQKRLICAKFRKNIENLVKKVTYPVAQATDI